ncbi:MAG: hypothetical protein WC461_03050 [Candidatus Paceibacterota bacterium]
MNNKFKYLFISLSAITAGLFIAVGAMALTAPTTTPPTGSGALYYSGGNVGIGTASPGAKLTVVSGNPAQPYSGISLLSGTSNQYTAVTVGRTVPEGYFGIAGTTDHYLTGSSAGDLTITTAGSRILFGPTIGQAVTMTIGVNVGIGTTNPGLKADILGVYGLPATSGTAQTGVLRLSQSGGVVVDMGINGASPYGGWIQSTNKADLSATYPLVLNPNGGSVGIGVTSPALRLDVEGASGYPATSGTAQTGIARISALLNNNVLDIGQGNSGAYGMWLQATDRGNLSVNYPLLLNPNGGKVGIGTTSPGELLEVNKTAGGAFTGIKIVNQISDAGTKAGVKFVTGITGIDVGAIYFDRASDSLFFETNNTARMAVGWTGNVGIGTTNPAYKLDINNPETSSDITAVRITNDETYGWGLSIAGNSTYGIILGANADDRCYDSGAEGACAINDYAEMMEFSEMPNDGDIITINQGNPGLLKIADKPNDSNVVGVASKDPAMVIGSYGISIKGWENNQPNDGTFIYPLALSGRKIINVTNENGDIKPGDKIISSSLKGYGMKALESDQVVGTALGKFDSASATETKILPNGKQVKIGKLLMIINVGYARINP